MHAAKRFRTLLLMLAIVAIWFAILVWFDKASECQVAGSGWQSKQGCGFLKFLFDWQTLIGGTFALVAALTGWIAINRQILQVDIQEKERIRAKREAARATLPLGLVAISEYAEHCAQQLALMLPKARGEGLPENVIWEGPKLPKAALKELKILVATLPPPDGSAFSILISLLQIQTSRLRSIRPSPLPNRVHVVVRYNILQYILDCAVIFARATALLGYARGLTENVCNAQPGRAEIVSALGQMGALDELPDMMERINGQYPPCEEG